MQEKLKKEEDELVRKGKSNKKPVLSLKDKERLMNNNGQSEKEKTPQDLKFDFNNLLKDLAQMKILNKVYITQV